MQTLAVVEDLDIIEYLEFCLLSGLKLFHINQFCLESAKEALGDGVVIAVALAAHAGLDMMIFQ